MSIPFTSDELKIMEGKYAALARKYGVSLNYVIMIAKGERETNTRISKVIMADIRATIEFFTPISND
jgi:hypothetical protein|tara:strand:+ start:1320 stop:1520 length:201 start_codon:yes stop_codon:yes gene_type:complete